jgi:tRNA-uridine 2-sulfurtransferase
MRVMVAMSGGVDSSVAAALLAEQGHDLVGVTLKLWGGASDSGCCSAADTEDARRVTEQLGLDHHTFDLVSDFEATVVGHYVEAHTEGRTPNPCVECNRHIKFGRLLKRARRLGFDALATGHYARVDRVFDAGWPSSEEADGGPASCGAGDGTARSQAPNGTRGARWRLRRGVDKAKDQSYVLSMLTQAELGRVVLPVGGMTKDQVRARACDLGLRTAAKPDSQEVCFIHSQSGRGNFLAARTHLHPGVVVDTTGKRLGDVPAVELVTVGQRKGMHLGGAPERRYAVSVDVPRRRVVAGGKGDLLTEQLRIGIPTWVARPLSVGERALVQPSAHGRVFEATYFGDHLVADSPERRVAPGQTVALYDSSDPDTVLGSALCV